MVALKRPSGSPVNRLLSRYLENESCTTNAPVHNDISEQRVLLLILEDGCMERLKLKLQGRADGVTNLRACLSLMHSDTGAQGVQYDKEGETAFKASNR